MDDLTYSYTTVYVAAMANTHQEITITLAKGETTVAPGTTKKAIHGPGVVVYRAYRDGGLDVIQCTGRVRPY